MMGKVIMSGIVPQLVGPSIGILASDIVVGSSVYLMENGVATEYLVVNQGIPSNSSLYDSSCDGLWLLRKNAIGNMAWHSSQNNYANSNPHVWLNGNFFDSLGVIEKSAIKQVKIPYANGNTLDSVESSENGLATKVFLLSNPEVAHGTKDNQEYGTVQDGARLAYFKQNEQSKRVATLDDGSEANWYLRSPCRATTNRVWCVGWNGYIGNYKVVSSRNLRPALILPTNALFDTNTLILKGVA